MNKRYPDWQTRLEAFLAARQSMPFAWGTQDCAIHAANAVHVQTGYDPAAGLRAHRTAQEAADVLREGGGVRGLAAARLGAPIAPALAGVGDIGLVSNHEGRDTLAVCGGAFWLAAGDAGLVALPGSAASAAWRIE